MQDFGLKEIPGGGTNPRIAKMILASATWLDDDDSQTSWCGAARGMWGIETGTGVPPAHYRAKSWLNWGENVPSVKEAILGDTVILQRSGGAHVALFNSYDSEGDTVALLGGNQGDSVKISNFPVDLILGIRRGYG